MKRSWFGMGLVAIGIYLLLQNMGLVWIDIGVGDLWPLIVLAVGASMFVKRPWNMGATVTLAVGAAFTLDEFGMIPWQPGSMLVPFILLAIGASFLLDKGSCKVHVYKEEKEDDWA